MDLAAAYAACAETTRREAKNFYYAFLSLRPLQRQSIYALYAFCREADDVADSPNPLTAECDESAFRKGSDGGVDSPNLLGPECGDTTFRHEKEGVADSPNSLMARKQAGIDRLRARLAGAANGKPQVERDLALADTLERFGVDPSDLADVIRGVEMDLHVNRVPDEDAMRDYCYHVASAVGLATLPILNNGTPPTDEMRELAIDLGLGMQYVNILRDVREDILEDRIYLPADEMTHFGVSEETLADGRTSDAAKRLLAHHADRARTTLDRGLQLVTRLPRSGRACPWLLGAMYGRILARIVRRDYDVWSERVSLPKAEKLWLLLTSRWRT